MRTFDPPAGGYDGRQKMAETLARSSGAGIAGIGLVDLNRRRVLDMWTGSGSDLSDLTERSLMDVVTKALAVSLSLQHTDPSLNGRQMDSGEPRWLKSRRYLIGFGTQVGDLVPFVALVCDPNVNADTPERRRLVELGLTYAGQILHERLASAGRQSATLPNTILRSLSVHFAVVDATGDVSYLQDNPDDWLSAFEELQISNGRISARTPKRQAQLQAALSDAVSSKKALPSVLTFDAGEGVPKTVVILPMPDGQPRALMVFGPRDEEDGALSELVLESFGLTLAERRLALLLLSGKSLKVAANEANLTISTARSYLKRIFAKTGINRQSQLMSLYYRMMPSIRALPPSQDR